MSFSAGVKEELLRAQPEKSCCMLSEISAYTQSIASLRLAGGGRVKVVYETENTALAKRIFILLKKRLEITAALSFTRYARLGGRRACLLTVNEQDSRHLLVSLRMLREEEGGSVFKGIPRAAMTRRCCRAAFVRAAFLGAGSMSDPENGYHMEFVSSQSRAEVLTGILEKSGLSCGVTDRRGNKLVYIRKGDDVVSCLALMGAHQSLMKMENVRILRDSRNQANRATNCDQANLNKQLSAGAKQAAAITAYSLKHSLGGLPKELQEIGRLRMLNPDVSLEELGKMLTTPVGKSGANHKMRKLMHIIAADNENSEGEEK
ncbi:MAG: DNA-binding protein WhiA [Clostridia bacterium]|nr:DNA-binding protein WhiA [Clostridia bacterium]